MSENDDIARALISILFKIAKVVIGGILIAAFTYFLFS